MRMPSEGWNVYAERDHYVVWHNQFPPGTSITIARGTIHATVFKFLKTPSAYERSMKEVAIFLAARFLKQVATEGLPLPLKRGTNEEPVPWPGFGRGTRDTYWRAAWSAP